MGVAVIADIIGSRKAPDRGAVQRAIDDAIVRVERDHPLAEQPLKPVLGDELQGTYPSLESAMASLLLLRLALPDGVECRYGIGVGAMGLIPSRSGDLAEGPGWWAAREAIEAVAADQRRAIPATRTRVKAAAGEDERPVRLANAYLLARDQLVGEMNGRSRRLAYGRIGGRTQVELAASEGISQSAVSQALAAAGVPALIEGFHQLTPSAS
jgi:hypothetical protein